MPLAINEINSVLGLYLNHGRAIEGAMDEAEIFISETVDPGFLFPEASGRKSPF